MCCETLKILRVSSLAMFSIIGVAARADQKLEHRHWTLDGVKREAVLHVPHDAKTHLTPLVFAFHGHGESVHDLAEKLACHTHWPEAIVVYMQGLPKPDGRPGWQYKEDEEKGRDLKFFDAVWSTLHREYKIDSKRVYAAGFSNGAGFTFLLWALYGDRFAAVATCAMKVDKVRVLPRFKPKPFMHVAGKKDDHIAFDAQVDTVDQIRKLNRCGDGHAWHKHGTLYNSKTATPVVFVVHPHGHIIPPEARSLVVTFFKEIASVRKTGRAT